MNTPWRVEMLGRLRAVRGDLALTHFETKKAASLLAYLALRRRPHPREVLAEMLWPDEDPEVTRDRFRQALASLRRVLEGPGGSAGVVTADRSEAGINPAALTTDVAEFEAALEAARRAPLPEERAACFVRAAGLYGGELLPGFYDDWVGPERTRLGEAYHGALAGAAAALEAGGNLDEAIAYAKRLTLADPLREEAHHELMRLYLRAGRRAEAQRQYRELERILRQELGAAPDAAARALLALLAAEPPAPAAEPTPAATPGEGQSAPGAARARALSVAAPEGGAVPLDSPYYIVRPTDAEFGEAAGRGDSVVLVKGPRQAGKTSLLARGLHGARRAGGRVVLTDLQKLTEAQLASPDALLLTLAGSLAEQLELQAPPEAAWDARRGWNVNFERFLRREALGGTEGPLVWGLDEVDRLFGHPYHSEVFGLFRSWHNERALNPDGPWGRLTLCLAYATEAHLFITDLNQSPFNVGTRLTLEDFTQGEVAELNRRYGEPLRGEEEMGRFIALVGGHPYLAQRGLQAMAARGLDVGGLEAEAGQSDGPFGDHLRRMLTSLRRDEGLCDAVRRVLRGQPCPDEAGFYRLRSAGVLAGRSASEARPRCGLYGRYLERRLS